MIEELCAKLREKRKELNYTFEEVVEKTKIDPSVIRHIEDCDFKNIGPTYLKGFIKIYAAFLGIDVGDTLKQSFSPVELKYKDAGKNFDFIFSFKTKGYFIIFISLVVAAFLVFNSTRFIKNILTKRPLAKAKNAPTLIFAGENTSGVGVSIAARRKCFLKVKVDNKLLFEGILKRGAVESWKAKKIIELKISDGSAVTLEVNGKILPLLTSLKKPIKNLKITPTSISVDK